MVETTVSIADYINTDMKQKVMKKITLKALDHNYKYESYKVKIIS